ncbi:hypothetical protein [Lacisediminihabitans sp. H27-G8]|uniref:hypothetical protein n=1 Tax=Lacisediminihabitans sp. H27-G8 TaxID=3111909 RepID=UPI0038FCE3E9
MMDLSFRWPHPRYSTAIGELSFRLHTFENVYGIDPALTSVEVSADGSMVVDARGLSWAGGQATAPGTLRASITPTARGVRVEVSGEHADGIRSIGVTVHDLPTSAVSGVREDALEVPPTGRILSYPNGWFDLSSPSFIIGDALAVRSIDGQPRPKTFAFIPHFDDAAIMDVDLLVEADATHPSAAFDAPGWVIEPPRDVAAFVTEHREHIARAYPTDTWEHRSDVPEWMREKSLVLTLHGKHFTGRTFLDYSAMLDVIRQVARQIDGSRVLAYLPGWEGRYYRWYGRYDVDPALGGEEGFRRLVDESRELGVHVMPMFGANIASRDVPGFERWGEPGIVRRASGLMDAGSVDWDGSRHYDHGSGAMINPAFAPWRAHLVEQIGSLHERFGFDATFLDITAMHSNDPNGDTTEGLRSLAGDILRAIPGHLIAGEAWFDALSSIIPLVQTGHHDTVPVYHDLPDDQLFTRTNRSFGHVCLGDPAHGSSGVHEAGYVSAWRLPVRRGVIPTMGVVEDTLALAPDRVSQIISDAREYAELYLESESARTF